MPAMEAANNMMTPRKTSMLQRVPTLAGPNMTLQRSIQARGSIAHTVLSGTENTNAIDTWDTYVHASYLTQFQDLEQLLHSLQVPMQPISRKLCQDAFNTSKGRFSFRDFVSLLERLKTLHAKWMHKLRGKALDDDLLEAFVAVGGQSDSNGEVDLSKMRAVVDEFQLNVDLDRIIAEMDSDGSANIDFGEFASLIRDSHAAKANNNNNGSNNNSHNNNNHTSPSRRKNDDDEDDNDLFNIDTLDDPVGGSPTGSAAQPAVPITLSSMMYVDEDLDQALLFPPLGLTGRKDTGELSVRKRSEANLLTHRRRTLAAAAMSGDVTPHGTAHAANSSATTTDPTAKKQTAGGRTLPPARGAHPGRTQLATTNGAGGNAHGTTRAYYKGGGGLRNLTPAPGATSTQQQGEEGSPERRAHSSLAGGSPQRGTVRPPKKHKFAN